MILEDLFRNPLHLLTLLVVVMLIMGGTRLKDTMGGLGTGIKEFKKNLKDDSEEAQSSSQPLAATMSSNGATASAAAIMPSPVQTKTAEVVQAVRCGQCGTLNPIGSKHCNECGSNVG